MKRIELAGEGHPVQQKQDEYEEKIHESKRGRFGKNASKKKIPESQQYMNVEKQLEPNRNHAPREKMPAFIPKNPSGRKWQRPLSPASSQSRLRKFGLDSLLPDHQPGLLLVVVVRNRFSRQLTEVYPSSFRIAGTRLVGKGKNPLAVY